ncbi:MAG: hypothetical protein KGL39_46995 [Patescibacteria group bacterium]|nr:hypothetical protein [Patescibacteria group bacterium]
MRAARVLIPLFLICAVGVAGWFLFHQKQKQDALIKQAIANYKELKSQDDKEAELEAGIENAASDEVLNYFLSLMDMNSTTQIVQREQLETQYLDEWYSGQRAAAIASGADTNTIQELDQFMHKKKAEAIKDAQDCIAGLEKIQKSQ